jgi:DNA-binding transcriptional regulator LsrR (DeoR family)
MTARRRARAEQYARRVNAAAELLASGLEVIAASRRLAKQQRLSERQARRYVEQARDRGEVEVPSPKVVFTVKLPLAVARAVRQHARRSGQTIGALVAKALEEFLERLGSRSSGGR